MKRLRHHLKASYGRFLLAVSQGRKIPATQIATLAQGRVFTGEQALRVRLVDQLGGLSEAIQVARRTARLSRKAQVHLLLPTPDPVWKKWIKQALGNQLPIQLSAPLNRALLAALLPVSLLQKGPWLRLPWILPGW